MNKRPGLVEAKGSTFQNSEKLVKQVNAFLSGNRRVSLHGLQVASLQRRAISNGRHCPLAGGAGTSFPSLSAGSPSVRFPASTLLRLIALSTWAYSTARAGQIVPWLSNNLDGRLLRLVEIGVTGLKG